MLWWRQKSWRNSVKLKLVSYECIECGADTKQKIPMSHRSGRRKRDRCDVKAKEWFLNVYAHFDIFLTQHKILMFLWHPENLCKLLVWDTIREKNFTHVACRLFCKERIILFLGSSSRFSSSFLYVMQTLKRPSTCYSYSYGVSSKGW